jgi:hypothetical protein
MRQEAGRVVDDLVSIAIRHLHMERLLRILDQVPAYDLRRVGTYRAPPLSGAASRITNAASGLPAPRYGRLNIMWVSTHSPSTEMLGILYIVRKCEDTLYALLSGYGQATPESRTKRSRIAVMRPSVSNATST